MSVDYTGGGETPGIYNPSVYRNQVTELASENAILRNKFERVLQK